MTLQNAGALNSNNVVSVASGATLDVQNVNQTIAGLNDVSGPGATVTDSTAATTVNTLTLGGSGSYSFSGVISAATNAFMALTVDLTGSGSQTLNGVSTYAGNTTLTAGTLLVNGALASGSAVTVNGGTLGGTGTVGGATTVNAGFVAAGSNGRGTLTFSGNLTLNAASTNNFVVTTSGGVSNKVAVAGLLTPNGSVVHISSGSALAAGTYPNLFTYATVSGSFTATPVFDVAPAGTATIVDDAAHHINLVIASGVNLSPTNITAQVSGNQLILTWPADHTGWSLQVQTNTLATGLDNNWVTIPNSSSINSYTNTIDASRGTVFYRMFHQ
jgi:autotransporter-associated beta strand protein